MLSWKTLLVERPSSRTFFLGHQFLTEDKLAPVGHRRFFILESAETEAPSFRFLHSRYQSAKDVLSRKVNTVFGEDKGIGEVSATASYSILLQKQQKNTRRPEPRNWNSSNYTLWISGPIVYVLSFWTNHDLVPAEDAFFNELHKRSKRLADDAWAVKWDKRL